MKVEINHRIVDVEEGCVTLAQLLEKEGLNGPGQAVAVENRVVPRAALADTHLAEGMRITVIRAVCGG